MNDQGRMTPRNGVSRLIATVTAVLLTMTGLMVAPSAATASTATITPTVQTASSAGLSIAVSATGLPTDISGTYAALIEKGTEDQLVGQDAPYVAFALPFPTVTAGATSFTFTAPKTKLDRNTQYTVILWKQHSNATPDNIYGIVDLTVTTAQWNAVFATQTATTVKASKSSAKWNTNITLTATTTAGVAGKVQFYSGSKKLGSAITVKSGKATLKTRTLPVATNKIKAVFTPTNATAYKASTSSVKNVKITKVTPKVTTKLSKTKVKTSQRAKITVTAKFSSAAVKGTKVTIYDGKKKIKTVTLNSKGKATVTLPKLKAGTHKIKATVKSTKNYKAKSVTKTLRVVK